MALPLYSPNRASPNAIRSIVAVAAGKGGVGKSTVTVNLALALKAKGYRVGIMDTDIYGPSIRKMLPEDRLPSQKNDKIIPALCAGIKMISMAYFRRDHEAAAVRAPIANGLVTQFIKNVEWGELDFLLIDFPPGTGDVQLTLSQQANLTAAIMVTTPQEMALMDVRRAMDLFYQVKVPIVGVVENMSYYLNNDTPVYIFGQGGGERLAREKGVPFLGQIPLDPDLCQSGDRGQSLFALDPLHEKKITQAFMALADQSISHLQVMQQTYLDCLSSFEMTWQEMEKV